MKLYKLGRFNSKVVCVNRSGLCRSGLRNDRWSRHYRFQFHNNNSLQLRKCYRAFRLFNHVTNMNCRTFASDANGNQDVILGKDSLANKQDERFHAELKELDSMFQSINIGVTWNLKKENLKVGLTVAHELDSIADQSSSIYLENEFDTRTLNDVLMENPPSSMTYYYPHQYYDEINKIAKERCSFFKGNYEWTEIESLFLYNITQILHRAGGHKIMLSKGLDPSLYDTKLAYEITWKRLKTAFDSAMEKYYKEYMQGFEVIRSERTWKELAHHYKVLRSLDWCMENRFYYHNLTIQWFTKYNFDNRLFDPIELSGQFKETERLMLQLNPDFEYTVPTTERYRCAVLGHLSTDQFSKNEEIMLYGAMEDRAHSYQNRGCSPFTSNAGTELNRRTWVHIKKQYDLGWKNAISNKRFLRTEYKDRSEEDLRLHYKMIFMKQLIADHTEKEKGYIFELAKEWYCNFNINNELISEDESLATQEDDRYFKQAVSDPKLAGATSSGVLTNRILLFSNNTVDQSRRSKNGNTIDSPMLPDTESGKEMDENCSENVSSNTMKRGESSAAASSKPQRSRDDWTEEEEIILFGVMLTQLQYTATIDDVVSYAPFANRATKEAFHTARKKYYIENSIPENSRSHCNRELVYLADCFTEMERKAPRDSPYENYLRHMWVNKYNKNSMLLKPDYYKKLFSTIKNGSSHEA